MTFGRRIPLAAACAGLALGLAACGGSSGGSDSEVASLDDSSTQAANADSTATSTTGSSSDPQDVLLAYTQCMRDEGIDLPDPDFSGGPPADGDGGGGPFGDIDQDDPEFQAAQEQCQPILGQLQQQFDEEDQQAFQDSLLEFAQCMRDNGVDVPDPDFSEGGPGGGDDGGGGPFGGNVDPADPDFQAAQEACQDILGDVPFGPGGGPGGGAFNGADESQ